MSLTEELNNDLMKNAEKKEQLAKSYGSGFKDERRPAGPTLEAVSVFKRDIEKIMASEEAGEMRSKEVAEKVWQANQSGCKKAQTLAAPTAGAKKLCVGQKTVMNQRRCGRSAGKKKEERRNTISFRCLVPVSSAYEDGIGVCAV